MENTITNLTESLLSLEIVPVLKFVVIFAVASLLLGVIGRLALGKRSAINHAVSSVVGIMFVYIVTIIIYSFNPGNLARFLSPLPFAHFNEHSLTIGLSVNSFPAACAEILSMVILAFLVNLLDTTITLGKKVVGWYLWRLISVLLSMVLFYCVKWLFNTYLPDVLVTYAPMILLGTLVLLLFLGVLKVLLSLLLVAVNPLIAALFTFFFSSHVGKNLSKAVLSTALLSFIITGLHYFGYKTIILSTAALIGYIPMLVVLLILWYLIGHVL